MKIYEREIAMTVTHDDTLLKREMKANEEAWNYEMTNENFWREIAAVIQRKPENVKRKWNALSTQKKSSHQKSKRVNEAAYNQSMREIIYKKKILTCIVFENCQKTLRLFKEM